MRADYDVEHIDKTLMAYGVDEARRNIIRGVLSLRLSRDPDADDRADEINDEINSRQAVDVSDKTRDSNLA